MATHDEIWRRYDAMEVRLTAPLSERMLALAGLRPGLRVLDLASGRGEPALRAARIVAPDGHVVGVDSSRELLDLAEERAALEGLSGLEFHTGDAAQPGVLPEGPFDVATCRWGLMYMEDPGSALRNARRSVRRGGALVAALWAEPERVPYYTLPHRLLEPYRPVPDIDFGSPGTFRYATLESIEQDLDASGWEIDHVEEMEVAVFEAEDPRELVDWARSLAMDPLLEMLSEADQRAWERALVREAAETSSPGTLQLGGISRIVRARPR